MRALVVWTDGDGETTLRPIECSGVELQKLLKFHGKYISHTDNSDALDDEMLAFFYHEDPYGSWNHEKFPAVEGPLQFQKFDLVVLTGEL